MQREHRVQERQVEVAVESIKRLGATGRRSLWAAAEDTRHSLVLVWLSEVVQIPNVNVVGVEMGGREALTAGWKRSGM